MLIIYIQITTEKFASYPTSFVVTAVLSGRTSAEEIFVNDGSGPTDTTPCKSSTSRKRCHTTPHTASSFPTYRLQPHIQTTYRRPKQWSSEVGRKAIQQDNGLNSETQDRLPMDPDATHRRGANASHRARGPGRRHLEGRYVSTLCNASATISAISAHRHHQHYVLCTTCSADAV
jgi:hypothetical protein